jgi:formate hydrogenlyase transcriptional activator
VILSEGRILNVPMAEVANGGIADSDGTLESLERQYIIRALRDSQGVIAGPHGAAVRLGMKRTTLQSRILKMKISREEYA